MDATTLRDRLVADHGDVLAAAAAAMADAGDRVRAPADRETAADAVATALADAAVSDAEAHDRALGAALVDALAAAVTADGTALPADPVPAPPYLVPAARGVLVRLTTDAGRAVLLVRAFELTDGGRYAPVETADDPVERRLSVTVR